MGKRIVKNLVAYISLCENCVMKRDVWCRRYIRVAGCCAFIVELDSFGIGSGHCLEEFEGPLFMKNNASYS